MNKFTKRTLALATSAAVIAGTGVAFAYWTTTGAGTGSATVGAPTEGPTADSIRLSQVGTLTGFYPGSTPQTVNVKVVNPAAFSQKVGDITVVVGASGGCAANNWDVVDIPATTVPANAGPPATPAVPGEDLATLTKADSAPGSGTDEVSSVAVATIQLKETGVNQDVCQNKVPVLTFASAPGA